MNDDKITVTPGTFLLRRDTAALVRAILIIGVNCECTVCLFIGKMGLYIDKRRSPFYADNWIVVGDR